ncbi:MAG: hypothetical protein C4516_00010 [Oxalobacter sp.]|nr:MAG: hypothetical protein C4516_00010 [Oxalobacter sp.]
MKKQLRAFGFNHPLKVELERLITIQADLERTLRCLQMLVPPSRLMRESGTIGMALHTQALVSYVRCFTSGRRKGLSTDIFLGKPTYFATHEKIKTIRDKHVAHAVGEEEHCNVLVAAKDETSPAEGLGVRYWFFAGGDDKYMKNFLNLAEFANKYVGAEIQNVGNALAKEIMKPQTTWKRAQNAFYRYVSREEVYGPTRNEG